MAWIAITFLTLIILIAAFLYLEEQAWSAHERKELQRRLEQQQRDIDRHL